MFCRDDRDYHKLCQMFVISSHEIPFNLTIIIISCSPFTLMGLALILIHVILYIIVQEMRPVFFAFRSTDLFLCCCAFVVFTVYKYRISQFPFYCVLAKEWWCLVNKKVGFHRLSVTLLFLNKTKLYV